MTANAERNAYVTLVTNRDYADAAIALVRSIALTGTKADIVVLHTGAVDANDLEPLKALGAHCIEAELLDTSPEFNARHQRDRLHADAPFTKGNKPAFHTPLDNFAKLRLWELEQYDNCVFIDADARMPPTTGGERKVDFFDARCSEHLLGYARRRDEQFWRRRRIQLSS